MTTSFKLGKDRTTGKAISIEVASRGLSCDCVCFDCGKAFVAAKGEKNDWQHIAMATINKVDVLVSWNFKHIVNLKRIRGYNSVNLKLNYTMLEIRTPKEML